MSSIDKSQIVRRGFGLRKEVAADLARDYESALVVRARAAGGRLDWPHLTIRIAKEFGFCYGVDRAIDYAYETRKRFPEKRLFLTGEIIHNPVVNQRLLEIGYHFLDGSHGDGLGWDDVASEDVILIPAFGVSMPLLERMKSTGALLVDTTCGSVLNVWKNVERFAKRGLTCLIHGKWYHEETRATASRAMIHENGRYLVVRDLDEAEIVARHIEGRGSLSGAEFAEHFENASSPGFDPGRDLERIGMANQTTMLMSESLAIAERIREALVLRHGEPEIEGRFSAFDTICSATEDRQQAVLDLMQDPPQIMLVIGGYNSSNTGHLAKICSEHCPTYHVKSVHEIVSAEEIRHLPVGAKEPVVSREWLPAGDLIVGITAGASTPDREVGQVTMRLLELRGLDPEIS